MNDEPVFEQWLIHGKVQGVGYRWHMQQAARLLNLEGWCRNLNDTSCGQTHQTVEAVVRGPAMQIQKLYQWALHGPPEAKVLRIDRAEAPEYATIKGKSPSDAQSFPFEIRR